MIWFTADLHLYHKNIIRYTNRPFKTVHEMNTTLIDNWNSKIDKEDTVYFLGDFAFWYSANKLQQFKEQLNGHIFLIRGNHDRFSRTRGLNLFEDVYPYYELTIEGVLIKLVHVFDPEYFNNNCLFEYSTGDNFLLFAHSHNTIKITNGYAHDVGVDANNYYPISIPEVFNIMKEKRRLYDTIPVHTGDKKATYI